jgi:hypothetical protein
MANPKVKRATYPSPLKLAQAPGIAPVPIDIWAPPKGLDYLSPHVKIDKQHASQMLNIWLDRGTQRSRYGTVAIGSGIANLMAVMNFVDASGVGTLIRFTKTKVQRWDGSSWNDVYSGFTGGVDDHFAFTSFNNKLLFSNGVDGIFEFDFDLGTVILIQGAPPCKQLTTFDGRVLASNVLQSGNQFASRIVWSVKNNSHIWPDTTVTDETLKIGSGFEDLLSTPGGHIDQQRGVWPISDVIGLVVRSESVWQIMATGLADAPFKFDRLYDNIGSDAPRTIDTLPGMIIGLFNDDFYILSDKSIDRIGGLIRDQVLIETTEPADAVGMYDPQTMNYWFSNQSNVYRYSLNDKGWSRHQYPFAITQMMRTKSSVSGLTIDELTGTIDDLDTLYPTIDKMVGTVSVVGNYFVSSQLVTVFGYPELGYVIQESASLQTDASGTNGTASPVNSNISLSTGGIAFGATLTRNQILQAQLECDVAAVQTLLMEISRDGGQSWETYSLVSLSPDANQVIPFRKTVDSRLITLRLSSATLGKLRITCLWAVGQPGAPVNL